jgi:hypothetical protein
LTENGSKFRKLAYLDGHDRAQSDELQTGRCPEITEETLIDTLAELAQKFAVVLEKGAQDNRNAENMLPVWHPVKKIVAQVQTELYHLFRVTTGAGKRPQGDSGTNDHGMRRLIGIHDDNQNNGPGQSRWQAYRISKNPGPLRE